MRKQQLFIRLLGRQLRRRRIEKGLSMEQLSGEASLDDKHIGRIERGVKQPTSYTLFKISRALDIDTNSLFHEIEKEIEQANPDDL